MTGEKTGFHRAWLVFIGVAMMNLGGMSLLFNVIGNFFPAMAMEFGLVNAETGAPDVTRITLLMTVYSYVMLVWLPFSGRLYDKVDARVLFSVAGLLAAGGAFLLGIWTNVWQIYITGVMWGLAGPFCFLVGPSAMIYRWFAPSKAGRFLGIALAVGGLGTFFWSPLFASLISSVGYRHAFMIEGVVSACLILIPAIFFFRNRPEDVGLRQYGIENEEAAGEPVKKSGVSGKFALATVTFWAIFILGGLISLGGGYKSMMPAALKAFGLAENMDALTMLGASMISAAAIGNLIGKLLIGFMVDKWGARLPMVVFAIVNIIGFLLLAIFLPMGLSARIPLLCGGFAIGTADAMMVVGLPSITRECFGSRCYDKIYSYFSMAIAILGGLGATFVAVVAKGSSFSMAYGVGMAFHLVIAICAIIAVAVAKKFKDKWTLEGEPEMSRH